MRRTKIAITLDENTLQRVDRLITAHIFPNRSQAIYQAVEEKLQRMEHSLLAKEWRQTGARIGKSPFRRRFYIRFGDMATILRSEIRRAGSIPYVGMNRRVIVRFLS